METVFATSAMMLSRRLIGMCFSILLHALKVQCKGLASVQAIWVMPVG
jgi:hypothetical protein